MAGFGAGGAAAGAGGGEAVAPLRMSASDWFGNASVAYSIDEDDEHAASAGNSAIDAMTGARPPRLSRPVVFQRTLTTPPLSVPMRICSNHIMAISSPPSRQHRPLAAPLRNCHGF
jgi:hypothetical protein